jgi:phosphatidylserine decarboxylase
VLSTRFQTPVSKKNTNPTYDPKDATFDFPIYLSLADKLGVVELVIWDKDMLTKEYLGEVAILLEDWFGEDNAYAFDDPNNKVR